MTYVTYASREIEFSTMTPPVWSAAVDRWYQLDAPAFALAEAWTQWSKDTSVPMPTLIIGASATASNGSDRAFAEAPRANRFVHTLPSVRYAALCQVMRWAGPLLCVQDDPKTFLEGLTLAMDFQQGSGEIWVLGTRPTLAGARVDWLRIGNELSGDWSLMRSAGDGSAVATDTEFFAALRGNIPVVLEGGARLVRT